MRVRLGLVCVAATCAAACGGGGSGSPGDGGSKGTDGQFGGGADASAPDGAVTGEPFPLSCDGLEWSRSSAAPFDRLRVQGLPEEAEQPFVAVGLEGARPYLTFLETTDGAGFDVIVPPVMRPGDWGGAGTLELTILGENVRCPTHEVEVSALPAAPEGTVQRVLDSYDAFLTALTAQMGTDLESIRSVSAGSLPPQLLPVALADTVLSLPGSDDTLAKGVESLSDEDLKQAAKLLHALEVAPMIEEYTAGIEAIDHVNQPAPEDQNLADLSGTGMDPVPPGSVDPSERCQGLDVGTEQYIQIPDIETLVSLLKMRRAVKTFQASAVNTFRHNAAGVLSALISGPSPALSLIFDNLMLFTEYAMSAVVHLFPSHFPSPDFTFDLVDNGVLNEDHATEGRIAYWSSAKIHAKNDGWRLLEPSLNLVLTNISLGGGVGTSDSVVGTAANKAFGGTKGMAIGAIAEGTLNTYGGDALKNKLKELPDARCWHIPSTKWGPFDVTSDEYTDSEAIGDAIAFEGNSHKVFTLQDTGTATVRLRLDPEEFLTDQATEREVVIRKKVPEIEPAMAKVAKAGNSRTLVADINQSDFDTRDYVAFDITPSTASIDGVTERAPGLFDVDVTTPPDEDDFPVQVFVESLSDTLPEGTPNRQGMGTIEVGADVSIESDPTCISLGESRELHAKAVAPAGVEVRWSTDNGSIEGNDRTAVYTAPGTGGTATITAELSTNASITDTVDVSIGGCSGLAFYPRYTAKVSYPGSNCAAAEDPDQERSWSRWGENPGVADLPGWSSFHHGETKSSYFEMSGTSPRGFRNPDVMDGDCTVVEFGASTKLESWASANEDGTRLDIGFDVGGSSVCKEVPGNDDPVCSTGRAGSQMLAFFVSDIEKPTTYTIDVHLECTGPPAVTPTMGVIVVMHRVIHGQSEASGPNGDDVANYVNPFIVPMVSCNENNPVIDVTRTVDLMGPLTDDGADTFAVEMIGGVSGYGNPGERVESGAIQPAELGPQQHDATMTGFVEVTTE